MKNAVPNTITIISLVLSSWSIILTFEGNLSLAAHLLIICCICDFLDGFAARLLKVNNPLGAQLDSLVDMIAFGLAPAMLMFQFTKNLHAENPIQILTDYPWLFYITFLIPILSAFRLAKFNIDTRQTKSFIGLAVPAHATFYIFAVIVYLHPELPALIDVKPILIPIFSNPLIMLGLTVLLSFMLIAEVPMFSLKVKNLKWSENQTPLTFLFILITLSVLINIAAFPIIILLYIVWSIIAKYIGSPKSI
jgi:CDP-diacylglycerol--serine O-phosphatidyltransferase